MEEISLRSATLFHLGPLTVTNSILATWVGMLVLIGIGFLATRRLQLVPSGIQNATEAVLEALLGLVDQVTQDRRKTETFFPLLATFFLFILVLNWIELVPGFSAIHVHTASGEAHLFRAANTDLNTTLALALISVIAVQIAGIATLGFARHASHYVSFKPSFEGVIGFFVGLLHIIGEVAKVMSFSFRLFGNIFAGVVLLIVIGHLLPYLAPVPFYLLELFVGLIQALVFTMLSLVFLTNATQHAEH